MIRLSSKVKHTGMAIIDVGLVMTAFSLSLYLRFDGIIPGYWMVRLENLLIPAILINITIYYFFGLYRRIWRYAGINDAMFIVMAVTSGAVATYFYSLVTAMLPRSAYIIAWFLLLFFVGGSRLLVRVLANFLTKPLGRGERKNAVVVGAGEAGVMVARELKKHGSVLELTVIGFIDDDASKRGQIIHGLPVFGTREVLPSVVEQRRVEEVIIAMPSAPYGALQEIVGLCARLPVRIKTVPGIYEILSGRVNFSSLKEVDIEDLLRRPPVEQDMAAVAEYLAGRTVLVTGAGGSIGAELCRQIASLRPRCLLLLDHDENGMFFIHNELETAYPALKCEPLVLDIKERDVLAQVFAEKKPAVVFHAAAHKHVPLMELNAEEAVRNNVVGSKNVIDLASEHGVQRFVFVSTDKAVNPSSVMGATKRVVEIYLQDKARRCKSCVFCAVRFGNVLGSQGSVVLLFREQIARGGPVTVTHPEMKRYFMTIPEAVQLVIQAGALGRGGEIFVLDMGEPVSIVDMARDMIILSGLEPDEDIEITFSGLRPGEKMLEELFNDRENFVLTRHERIFIAPDTVREEAEIESELAELAERMGLGERLEALLRGEEEDVLNLGPAAQSLREELCDEARSTEERLTEKQSRQKLQRDNPCGKE